MGGHLGADSVEIPLGENCDVWHEVAAMADRYHSQEMGNWCWAACSQMILEQRVGYSMNQCDMAKRYARLTSSAQIQCAQLAPAAVGACDDDTDRASWPDRTLYDG